MASNADLHADYAFAAQAIATRLDAAARRVRDVAPDNLTFDRKPDYTLLVSDVISVVQSAFGNLDFYGLLRAGQRADSEWQPSAAVRVDGGA